MSVFVMLFFLFKQKTAYEMRISDWSSDVCSSDLHELARMGRVGQAVDDRHRRVLGHLAQPLVAPGAQHDRVDVAGQHPGRVGDGLAAAKLDLLARDRKSVV